jgi:hypothetical protein
MWALASHGRRGKEGALEKGLLWVDESTQRMRDRGSACWDGVRSDPRCGEGAEHHPRVAELGLLCHDGG